VPAEDDIYRDLSLFWDSLTGPGALYRLERQFWLELWRAPAIEAIDEFRMEARRYGPVQATVIPVLPRAPLFNLVLGAADPGAVEEGHLGETLDWLESRDIDFRVPIRSEFQESGAAEDLLNQRGYRRNGYLARFVRDASPPDFPEPAGIEVDEFCEETEGFSDYFVDGLEVDWQGHCLFDSLPGRRPWRGYVAIGENDLGVGAAMMLMHYEVAQLGFAVANVGARGKGVHMALLRRRILDAVAAGAGLLFADTEEPSEDLEQLSPAARNLIRAGFRLVSARPVWQPPALPEIEEDEEDEEDDDSFDLEV
jgi:hypothetical protein